MPMAINGDAVLALTRLLNHGAHHRERPLTTDLLWTVTPIVQAFGCMQTMNPCLAATIIWEL